MEHMLDPQGLTLWGVFVTSVLIGLSGAVMPGPITAMIITHAARMGVKAGPLVGVGHAALEALLLIALALGLGPVLSRPLVAGGIGAVGAVILAWLAVGMLRSLPGLHLDLEVRQGAASGPVRDGVLLSLVNPYWSLWWATIGISLMTMVSQAGLGWWGLLVFFLGHMVGDMSWFTLISGLVKGGRRFLNDRVYRVVVAVCAVFLLGFAAFFGVFAWQRFSPVVG